ncbi:AAA family ATPase [Promicromonospora sukumoe]|uniref:AAA family ATPase n=1 Tax=Promicromonospora sukumoe TaxID=88382 RepID=UPI0003664262|nr:AAA family ATPase [Promicromonospora sukumoe]
MSGATAADVTPGLLVVTGPPGSGKSTVSEALADLWEPSVLVEGDAFFRFLRRGMIPPWLPESHAQNDTTVRAAAAAAGGFAAGGMAVVYDGVIGPWFLPTFARLSGVEALDYVVLLPPVETCLKRVETRTGHGFTDLDAARHMYEDFARATKPGAVDPAGPSGSDGPGGFLGSESPGGPAGSAGPAGSTGSAIPPGAVLRDLPDDVAGVAEAIVAAMASGRTRYTVS